MHFLLFNLYQTFVTASTCPGLDGDAKCESLQTGSYCRYWKSNPTCHGNETPCTCGNTCTKRERHAYCENIKAGSYCKFWKARPVCQWTNKPCACVDILSNSEEPILTTEETTSTIAEETTTIEPVTIEETTSNEPVTTEETTSTIAEEISTNEPVTIEETTTNEPVTIEETTSTIAEETTTNEPVTTEETTTESPHDWPPHNLPFKVGLYSWVTPDNLFYSFLIDPANLINGDLYIATNGHHFVDIVEKLRKSTKTFSRIYAVYGDNTVFTDTTNAIDFIDDQYNALNNAINSLGKDLGQIGISLDIERAPNNVLLSIINYAKSRLRQNFPDYKIQIAINGATAVQRDGGFYEERGRIANEEVDYALLMSYRNFVTPGDGLLGFFWEDGDVTGLFKRYPGLERRTTSLVTVEGPSDGSGEGCHIKVTYGTVHAWKKPNVLTFGKPNQIIDDFKQVSEMALDGKMTPGGEFGVHQYSMFRCFMWDYTNKNYPEYNQYVHGTYGGDYHTYADLLAVHCPPSYYRPCEFNN